MIPWFTTAQVIVAVAAGLFCVIRGLAKRTPDDVTLGATALVEVLLVVQLVVALLSPGLGNSPTGSMLEFYIYLVSAIILPPVAVLWALVERTRWSTVVLGVVSLAIAVMVYRMNAIWFFQTA